MSVEGQKFYPGDEATPKQLVLLAAEYRQAAALVLPNGRRGKRLSYSPYRLVLIQAVELYLDAYLRTKGHRPRSLRGLQHDLSARADFASASGLQLKDGTKSHLKWITANREYLIARYEPDPQCKLSEINRLQATLDDVAHKVELVIDGK